MSWSSSASGFRAQCERRDWETRQVLSQRLVMRMATQIQETDEKMETQKRKLDPEGVTELENVKVFKQETVDEYMTDIHAVKTNDEKLLEDQDVKIKKELDYSDRTDSVSVKTEESHCAAEKESTQDNNEEPTLLDPFSYTAASEFTSEIYKIQIHNLPKFGFGEIKKRLKTHLRLNPHKIKSQIRHGCTYVCFKNEPDRQDALKKINGHIWKGKTLEAKTAAPVADPYLQQVHKRENHGQKVKPGPEETLELTPEEAETRLKDRIIPLWNTEYSEQLRIKTGLMAEVLKAATRHSFVKHMFRDRSQFDGLICPLLPIIPSPITSEYRNKNEFSIGYGLDGKTITIGFRFGLYKDGSTAVGDCSSIGFVHPAALPVIESFRLFVCQSDFLPYQQQTASGNWHTLAVKTFRTGDVMAIVDFVVRDVKQESIEMVKKSIKDFYTEGPGKDVHVTSFYFRLISSQQKNQKDKPEFLLGNPHVYEDLLELRFRISPDAFFQVNTMAAEKLYRLVAEWSKASTNSTVLDLCCGTGTIGLSMAKNVKDVIGIEMCQAAVEDAKVNATVNGITNATFHCAKVEDIIATMLASIASVSATEGMDVVAIVDPPRAGLHKNVIKALRKHEEIQRLVYVSCNAKSALDNFVHFIRPSTGKFRGLPFKMVKAKPVDLFPGTHHCELVILFERVREDDHSERKSDKEQGSQDMAAAEDTV